MVKKKSIKKEPNWEHIGQTIGKKIEKEFQDDCCKPLRVNAKIHNHGCRGAFYGLGVIGAAVYFISTAAGFWTGVLGVLKALVWPAFVVYGILKFFGL